MPREAQHMLNTHCRGLYQPPLLPQLEEINSSTEPDAKRSHALSLPLPEALAAFVPVSPLVAWSLLHPTNVLMAMALNQPRDRLPAPGRMATLQLCQHLLTAWLGKERKATAEATDPVLVAQGRRSWLGHIVQPLCAVTNFTSANRGTLMAQY